MCKICNHDHASGEPCFICKDCECHRRIDDISTYQPKIDNLAVEPPVPPVSVTAPALVSLFEKSSLRTATELDFQFSTANALYLAGIPHRREVILSSRSRVDFMVGNIAIELKIDGTVTEVLRQLQRYAQHEEVGSIVLLTSTSKLCRIPQWLSEKPVLVALIQRGIR